MSCCATPATLCHAVPCRAVPRSLALPSLTLSLPPQCGFFKRSSRKSRYAANYYRARLGLQPSAVEKQALEGER